MNPTPHAPVAVHTRRPGGDSVDRRQIPVCGCGQDLDAVAGQHCPRCGTRLRAQLRGMRPQLLLAFMALLAFQPGTALASSPTVKLADSPTGKLVGPPPKTFTWSGTYRTPDGKVESGAATFTSRPGQAHDSEQVRSARPTEWT
jgi:hypothetical protein